MTDKRSKPLGGKPGIFIGGILLVAAVIAFVSLDGYPPADGDSVGAIGAAKRYRSEQITESDVQLQDEELVALLQSDEMQRLIKDESFQKAVKDQNWAALMENDYFRRVFFDKKFLSLTVETDLASRKAEYVSLRPEEAYKVFLDRLEEVELKASGPRLSQIVADDEFKRLFLDHKIMRELVLDVDLVKQRLDADVVSRQMDLDWNKFRLETDYAKLTRIYLDEELASRNPRLAQLAADAEFKQLFENQEWVRRIVLDKDFAHKLLDVELVSRLRKTEFARVRPEEAYRTLLEAARDAEVATPRPSARDMATDAEFQSFFQHEMASTMVLDVDFFRPLMEAGLASRLTEVKYANLRPEEKYNSFLEAVKDASLMVPKDRLLEVAQDAKFASWFRQSEFLQSVVLDAAYARKFYEVALASRSRQTEFINLRPEERFNGWLKAEADASMVAKDREIKTYAVDAEFAELFKNQKLAQSVLVDQELMRQLLDAELVSRFSEINYANLRPEVALNQLQAAVADAKLAGPNKLEALVNDAAFAQLFKEHRIMRQVILDQDYARRMMEVGMYSRLAEVNLVNLRPEVAYRTFLAAANDASLVTRNARMADWAADAQFKQMFENMKLAQTMVLDAELMRQMLDAGFNTALDRADVRTVITDADYLTKYYTTD